MQHCTSAAAAAAFPAASCVSIQLQVLNAGATNSWLLLLLLPGRLSHCSLSPHLITQLKAHEGVT
jgi:hypothetical protein